MALPNFSIPSSKLTPNLVPTLNCSVSLPTSRIASSPPRSSPKATLNWLATFTNSNISFFPVLPKRPACSASFNSSMRGVRVFKLRKSLERLRISLLVKPVVFLTSACASASSTLCLIICCKPITTPVRAAPTAVIIPILLLKPLVNLSQPVLTPFISLRTFFIRPCTFCNCLLFSIKRLVPGVKPAISLRNFLVSALRLRKFLPALLLFT